MVSVGRSETVSASPGKSIDRGVDARKLRAPRHATRLWPWFSKSARAVGEHVGELGRDDDVLRLDDVDAMGERGTDQVDVDQRNDTRRRW